MQNNKIVLSFHPNDFRVCDAPPVHPFAGLRQLYLSRKIKGGSGLLTFVNAHQTGGQVNGWRVAVQVSYIYESSISKSPKNNSCLCRLLCLGIESMINPKFIAVSMFRVSRGNRPTYLYLLTYLPNHPPGVEHSLKFIISVNPS